MLLKHRRALDSVAEALLEHETIDGADVARLVQDSLEPSTDNANSSVNS
jgi:cell division protease FtsH